MCDASVGVLMEVRKGSVFQESESGDLSGNAEPDRQHCNNEASGLNYISLMKLTDRTGNR